MENAVPDMECNMKECGGLWEWGVGDQQWKVAQDGLGGMAAGPNPIPDGWRKGIFGSDH